MQSSLFSLKTTSVCFYLLYINFVIEFIYGINYFLAIAKINKIKI